MNVLSIVSTKGGVGKTTTAANLGGFIADAGLRVLLLDLDVQPTLSSYFQLKHRAPFGAYELLAFNEHHLEKLVCHTTIPRLDLLLSNDGQGQLNTLLLHAADGRLRLRNLLPLFQEHYDLLLIDTQGARSVLLEMVILASDQVISPVTPEILAARELQRGTLKLLRDLATYQNLGISLPPLSLLINRVHPVSANARLIQFTLRKVFLDQPGITVLDTTVPAIEAYPRAATQQQAVHRVEMRRPSGRLAPAALETMRSLACELFPQWEARFKKVGEKKLEGSGHAHV
ncbi:MULTISPECIES: ParA family protein [unclassified Pseudomonas]|uniref:ParA family protein n=1 Tax=unclassified Pseudomonas TaxID=196821 RepID=UPI000C86A6C5|nr:MULTISPECIES: ParA family protein [unclassified Pseudomonas]PMV22653.1 chromosome partitioning protein [Pseudomonas sp. FW305-3-2-15-C-TSA2]PMV29316.1 chromosome partitioning protein [Pseudomonas sp. DP16D-L5]PMV39219.1 chromosome partitioning protein [Pseudomonas sp. FW305-3-2-15-A-LB2]PMV45529.1 chromosome partitioning protein [Pseudomonas sp. FW305-3-2-15-C-R2A1]PMV52028.1 chromosome partitioning protein [Pseudomonas sp. FW305-3-2-15-C-LB1]